MLTDYVRVDMETGRDLSAADYIYALNRVGKYRDYVSKFFEDYDLLMTPTTPVTAPGALPTVRRSSAACASATP